MTLREKLAECERERAELESIFKRQGIRMLEATKYWQAQTGNPEIYPDLGDMLHWFIERLAEYEQEKTEMLVMLEQASAWHLRPYIRQDKDGSEERISGLCHCDFCRQVRLFRKDAALTEAGEQEKK